MSLAGVITTVLPCHLSSKLSVKSDMNGFSADMKVIRNEVPDDSGRTAWRDCGKLPACRRGEKSSCRQHKPPDRQSLGEDSLESFWQAGKQRSVGGRLTTCATGSASVFSRLVIPETLALAKPVAHTTFRKEHLPECPHSDLPLQLDTLLSRFVSRSTPQRRSERLVCSLTFETN